MADKMDNADRWEFIASEEKQTRIAAQASMLKAQQHALEVEAGAATQQHNALVLRLREKYQMGDRDTLDKATGAITRVPVLSPVSAAEA